MGFGVCEFKVDALGLREEGRVLGFGLRVLCSRSITEGG